jgi:hypothetical protein
MRTIAFLLTAALALQLGACSETYDYDPASAGEAEGSGREPRGKNPSQFVRSIYADILGRQPESYDFTLSIINEPQPLVIPLDEEAMLVGALDGIGDSQPMRNLIAKGLMHSEESTIPAKGDVADPREFIREQFRKLLGREPNPYELANFENEWRTDSAVGPRAIIRAIVGSREYQSQ